MATEPRMRTAHSKKILLYFSDVLLNRGGKFLKVRVKRLVSAILALKRSDTKVLCGKQKIL